MNIVGGILTQLPIRDAVRTSILSRAWRYEWTDMSEIVFDVNSFSHLSESLSKKGYDRKVMNIIDQVLLSHRGSIFKFKLSVELESSKHIDRWVLCVSRRGVREFILHKWEGELYKVHSCIFSCEEIINLELHRCILTPPASFSGFKILRTLDLQYVHMLTDALERLISYCPFLSELNLYEITGCTQLKLCAPNLVHFEVETKLEVLCFAETPILTEASIEISCDGNDLSSSTGAVCKLVDHLGCLPALSRLELLGQSYQIFSAGDVPVRLPTDCHLSFLSACIDFGDRQHVSVALCIFRSSPSLQEVTIESVANKTGMSVQDIWEGQEDCSLNQLQMLHLSKYAGTKAELRFTEFVLANAPVLQMVEIESEENFTGLTEFLIELVRFRRISSRAEIVIKR